MAEVNRRYDRIEIQLEVLYSVVRRNDLQAAGFEALVNINNLAKVARKVQSPEGILAMLETIENHVANSVEMLDRASA